MRNKLLILFMLITFSATSQNSIFWLNKPSKNQINWAGFSWDSYDLTSSNGKNWTKGTFYWPTASLTPTGIDWSGERWIRTFRSGNSFAYPQYSFDGKTWMNITSFKYKNWAGVFWDNYKKFWILSGHGTAGDSLIYSCTSVDGINWNTYVSELETNKISITGTRYIQHGSDNSVWSSNNLVNWHRYIVNPFNSPKSYYPNLRIVNTYWDGRKVIATGLYDNTSVSDVRGVIMTSNDGVNYTVVVDGEYTQTPVRRFNNIFEYKGDIYVRGQTTNQNFNDILYKSSDLISWSNYIAGINGESKGNELVFTAPEGTGIPRIHHTKTTLVESYNTFQEEFSLMKSRYVKNYPKMIMSCPIVRTTINEISNNYIKVRVYFESDGGADIIQKGICWSTLPNPTLADQHTEDGAFADDYTTYAIDLLPDTKYYIRSYAINSSCTVYSTDDSGGITYPSLSPTVSTRYITNIGSTSASFEGAIIADGGSTVTDRGFCWNTTGNPTIDNSSTSSGSGLGIFNSNVTGLSANTTYYVRAYGLNSAGYAYGSQLVFTTGTSEYQIPTLQGINISNISQSSADAQSTILSDGGDMLTGLGFCYSTTNTNPTTSDMTVGGVSIGGNLTAILTGLNPMTRYYIRAYATNSVGTGYSSVTSFETNTDILATLSSDLFGETTTDVAVRWTITLSSPAAGYVNFPLVITNSNNTGTTTVGIIFNNAQQTSSTVSTYSKGLSQYTAYCNFDTSPNGYYGSNTASYVIPRICTLPSFSAAYCSNPTNNSISVGATISSDDGCPITNRGFQYSTDPLFNSIAGSVSVGSGDGTYSTTITGLTCGTTYYVRAYAINNVGTAYSNELDFITLESPTNVSISTSVPVNITTNSATLGGNISSDGGNIITERGVVYGLSINPTTSNTKIQSGDGIGIYSVNVTGLTQGTTYHVRAYAINSNGTFYGADESFITSIDGATACNAGKTFPGGQSYPSTNTIVLGSGTGNVSLSFNALNVPDFFLVEYNSTLYNSGWRGSPIYDYGGTSRASFKLALFGKTDPSQNPAFPTTFPDIMLYPEDGYPRVISGSGSISFTKSTNNPTTAIVKVYAPMSGTSWNYTLSCPN